MARLYGSKHIIIYKALAIFIAPRSIYVGAGNWRIAGNSYLPEHNKIFILKLYPFVVTAYTILHQHLTIYNPSEVLCVSPEKSSRLNQAPTKKRT